jgi:ribosomal protein L14
MVAARIKRIIRRKGRVLRFMGNLAVLVSKKKSILVTERNG